MVNFSTFELVSRGIHANAFWLALDGWFDAQEAMGETPAEGKAKPADSAPSLTPDSPPVDTAKATLSASEASHLKSSPAGSSDTRASSEEVAEEFTAAADTESSMAAGGKVLPEGGKGGAETVDLETDSDATSEDEGVASKDMPSERAWGSQGESFSVWESAVAALEAAEESRKMGNDAFASGKVRHPQTPNPKS